METGIETKAVDIFSIDLIKASMDIFMMPETISQRSIFSEADIYTCLGHFDVMRVRKVDRQGGGTVFSDIWQDLCKKKYKDEQKIYIYSLYILHQGDGKLMEKFWGEKCLSIVISRVHCDQLQAGEKAEDILKACVKDLGKEELDNKSGDLSVWIDGRLVHCLFCQTLELGDITVILKSNSMSTCLQVSKRMMEHRMVGDVYSYCGLHESLFQNGTTPREACIKYTGDSSSVSALEEKLPKASMRFSIHSSYFANLFWGKKILNIQKKVRFVTGTADALVDLSGKSCFHLIDMIRKMGGTHSDKGKSYKISDAFDDVVTRVGIDFGEPYPGALPPEEVLEAPRHAQQRQQKLVTKLEELETNRVKENFDWILALSAQIRMLLTMLNNCVMDDLSLLIWPGAFAFVTRLHNIVCRTQNELSRRQVEEIETFLDGWSTLSNDIVHLESQLMQNPKLQAPRVYVPASLIAFYMAFLSKLGNLMCEVDAATEPSSDDGPVRPTRRYQPLIAHNIGLRTSTQCILDPSEDPSEDYAEDCALLVSMPVSRMYHPAEVTAILCHEYLHYAGEASRLRRKRYGYILKTCAGLILNVWGLDGRHRNGILLRNAKNAAEFLTRQIKKRVQERDQGAYKYIRKMKRILPGVISDIYLDLELQARVVTTFGNGEALQSGFISYGEQFDPPRQKRDVENLTRRLNEILLLYRECYADAAAIKCMDLKKGDYLKSMYLPEIKMKEKYAKGTRDARHLQMLAAQAALVCEAVWPNSSVDVCGGADEGRDWLQFVDKFIAQIRAKKELYFGEFSEEPLLIQGDYLPLESYLTACVSDIGSRLPTAKVLELNQMYVLGLQYDIDLDAFRQKIDEYHRAISTENCGN